MKEYSGLPELNEGIRNGNILVSNSDKVDGFHASTTPSANTIPVLNSNGQLWLPFNQIPILVKGQDIMNRTFYVDAVNGDDNNDGSESAPFKTIKKAVDSVPVGGYVGVRLKSDYTLNEHISFTNKCVLINLMNTYTLTIASFLDEEENLNAYYGIKPQGTCAISIFDGTLTLSGKASNSYGWDLTAKGSFIKGEDPCLSVLHFGDLTINLPSDAGCLVTSGTVNWASVHNLLFDNCSIVRDGGYILNCDRGVATLSKDDETTLKNSSGGSVAWSSVITGLVKDANDVPRNILSNIVL